jgi:hypothetical protein
MKRLEENLRAAMRRKEAPEGFTERVLARTAQVKQHAPIGFFASSGLRWALAGTICLIIAVAGIQYRLEQKEQARGEAAKAELLAALRITATELHFVQEKLHQHSVSWLDLNQSKEN